MRPGPYALRAAAMAALLACGWRLSRGLAVSAGAPAAAAAALFALQGALVLARKPGDATQRRAAELGAAACDILLLVWAVNWLRQWRAGLEAAALVPAVLIAREAGPLAGAAAGALPVLATAALAVPSGRPFDAADVLAALLHGLPAAAAGLEAGGGASAEARRSFARLRAAQFGEYLSYVMFQLRDYLITLSSLAEALAISAPKDDPKTAERVERLRRTVGELGGKLGRLLGDKHALTSYQATQSAVDVPALLRRLAGEARQQFGPEVRVDIIVEGEVPPAKSDRSVIEHAVLAVLQNAVEACRAKGSGRVSAVVRAAGGHAQVEVTDDGGGIPESLLSSVFEPIVSARGVGMGLGLSMTRRFLERIGGGVRLKSKGGFTAVLLEIPLDKALPMIRNEESTWAGRRAGA